MAIYKYKGKNKKNKTVRGMIFGAGEGEALKKIERKGIYSPNIRDISNSLEIKILFFINKVKTKDLVVFSRQFSVMVSASVTVIESLNTLIDQTENISLQKVVANVANNVSGGALLSDALEREGKVFSSFYINLVRSGETSGKLDEVLQYLADEMEKDQELTSKFKGAMIYPAFIVAGLLGVGVILMVFVIPELTSVLTETGAVLPWSTRMIIGLSNFLSDYIILILIVSGLGIFGIKKFLNTKFGKLQFDKFQIRMPLLGRMFKLIYLIRFTRSLSTLLKGGVIITKSLEICSSIVGNLVYKQLVDDTLEAVRGGESITSVFEMSRDVPVMVPQMMVVGEKTGNLDVILDKIADFYSKEVNNTLSNLMAILEPAIMMVMAMGVGIMIAAVIMPMYNLASQF